MSIIVSNALLLFVGVIVGIVIVNAADRNWQRVRTSSWIFGSILMLNVVGLWLPEPSFAVISALVVGTVLLLIAISMSIETNQSHTHT